MSYVLDLENQVDFLGKVLGEFNKVVSEKNDTIRVLDERIVDLFDKLENANNLVESYRDYKEKAKVLIEKYEKLQETYEGTLQAVIKERDEALAGQISGFYEKEYPDYTQGAPTNELQSVVTAAEVNNLLQSLIKTEEELAGIKNIYRTLIDKLG